MIAENQSEIGTLYLTSIKQWCHWYTNRLSKKFEISSRTSFKNKIWSLI